MTDFAQSCNNAFTTQYEHLSGALASTAKEYYGLDQKWDIGISGISASYFNAPASASGRRARPGGVRPGGTVGLAARDGLGRGHGGHRDVRAAVPGARHQAGDGHAAARGDRRGPQGDDARRRHQRHGGRPRLRPDVYAKTGTADIQNQGKPNSWLVAFDPGQDVAVGCLVLDAGYGAQFAAPEVQNFLSQY